MNEPSATTTKNPARTMAWRLPGPWVRPFGTVFTHGPTRKWRKTMFITTRDSPRETTPDLTTVSSRLNRLLSDAFGGLDWQYRDSAGASWVPPVDIFEDADSIRIMAEIPGVNPEAVKISLENNVLTIHGTKEQVAEERSERVHRYERTYGAFERSFTLPATVDANAIQATYENGVLTVTLPKVERAKPRQISVQVASK